MNKEENLIPEMNDLYMHYAPLYQFVKTADLCSSENILLIVTPIVINLLCV